MTISDSTAMSKEAAISGEVGRLVAELRQRGLAMPAHFLAEMYRPFTTCAETASYFVEPFARVFCSASRWEAVRNAFTSRENVDAFIQALELSESRR